MSYKTNDTDLNEYFEKEPHGYVIAPVIFYQKIDGEIIATPLPIEVSAEMAAKVIDAILA